MNVSSVNAPITTGDISPAAHDNPATPATDAAATGFAALLAGALAPQPQPVAAPAGKSTGSELDLKGDVETEGAGDSKDDAAKNVTGSDVFLALLGANASGLDMTLQTKLARVIARMKSEFGRDVKVAEGVRSQERQNRLFAQGRDEAGPIVTWTRNSQHTAGRAADLVIDGGYDDAAGFALMRQVAEQEGLHTLGARDPGHVELRGGQRATEQSPVVQQLNEQRPNVVGAIGIARVATVAAVARIADVARIATVARVAAPGGPARMESAPARDAVPTGASALAQPTGRSAASNANSGSGGERDNPRRTTLTSQYGDAGVGSRPGENAYRTLDHVHVAGGSTETPATDAGGDASSITAARTIRAMDAQDAPGPRTLSRLTLSLDDGQGGQDQVRIGMRGNSIGASFEMRDVTSADRVSARLGELTRALEQRGLEPQAFQVRTSSTVRDGDVARTATQATERHRTVADSAATRHDARPEFGGDARQRFARHDDQQERAQRRQDEQRRRGSSFSLTSEES